MITLCRYLCDENYNDLDMTTTSVKLFGKNYINLYFYSTTLSYAIIKHKRKCRQERLPSKHVELVHFD